jgi:carbamate kinase
VRVDIFIIATDVEGAALNYGQPNQRFLRRITIKDAERYMEERHFPKGSMQPKIQASIEFLKSGGTRAVITSIEAIESAVQGLAGTEIIR